MGLVCAAVRFFRIALVLLLVWMLYEFPFIVKRGGLVDAPFHTAAQREANSTLYTPGSVRYEVNTEGDGFAYTIHINNHGFRGRDIDYEPPRDTIRILVTGDSFTAGVGVEDDETIPAMLEKSLRRDSYPVEVINAGRGFASSIMHYINTRDIYLQFHPDVVVLLFDFSDLKDDWRAERNLIVDAKGKLQMAGPSIINGTRDWWLFFVLNSEVAKYIDRKAVRWFKKIQTLGMKEYLLAKLQGKRAKAIIAERKSELGRNEDPIEYDQYLMLREGKEELIKKHWQRSATYLAMLGDLLQQEGIPLVIAAYPYGIHVGTNQWDRGRTTWGFAQDKVYDGRFAFGLLENFTQEKHIAYIDTLEAIKQYHDEILYYPINGHFNRQGCARLAETLAHSPVLKEILDTLKLRGEPDVE